MADATSVLPPAGDVREVAIIAAEPANPIGEVSEGDTWAFRATGRWRDGYIPCGPSGYHFLPFDALAIVPQYSQAPWFSLVARFIDDPDFDLQDRRGRRDYVPKIGLACRFRQ